MPRHEELLTATFELTHELGRTPSVRQIARRTGSSVGAIGRHFGGRDGLLQAAEALALERLDATLRHGSDPLADLATFMDDRPCHAAIVFDLSRCHEHWPDDIVGRLMPDASCRAWSDVVATVAFLRQFEPGSGFPAIEVADLALLVDVHRDAEGRAHGEDDPERAMTGPELHSLMRKALSRRADDDDDLAAYTAATDLLAAGRRVSARSLARQLGRGMSSLYRFRTMSELRSELTLSFRDVLLPSGCDLDEAFRLQRRFVSGAVDHPRIMEYVTDRKSPQPSAVEERLERLIAEMRTAGRLRRPALSDELHRAIIAGPIVGRFGARDHDPDSWIGLAAHLGALRPVLLTDAC